jgi:hypothetical protein
VTSQSLADAAVTFTVRVQATLLCEIHSCLGYIFASEKKLSTVLDEMLEELEDGEVQALM